eukprot:TRINITY_DN1433_c0_g1_i5.p1 TRINITY_DN1433_c0_g1~~TRINITY_DN1433_c0_g1_i5.p1  ORF type:complete len:537 (-),score=104.05 TRINITY_DN1433_c0_g1_i5:658-2073(-)
MFVGFNDGPTKGAAKAPPKRSAAPKEAAVSLFHAGRGKISLDAPTQSAAMESFLRSPVGQAYSKPAVESVLGKALLMIAMLYKGGQIDQDERAVLKERALQEDAELMDITLTFDSERNVNLALERVLEYLSGLGDVVAEYKEASCGRGGGGGEGAAVGTGGATYGERAAGGGSDDNIGTGGSEGSGRGTATEEAGRRSSRVRATPHEDDRARFWSEHGTAFVYLPEEYRPREAIVALDMDGTVIKTRSGRTFATGPTDWVFWDESVPHKLREVYDSGAAVVIMSNQGGVGTGKVSPQTLMEKVNDIIAEIDRPVCGLFCTSKDHLRKPNIGMWELFESVCNGGVSADKHSSKYVGDAAGRAGDFSYTDRAFAVNLGLRFETPEEFFLNKPAEPFTLGFDPKTIPAGPAFVPAPCTGSAEVVLCVGRPASGKSFFAKKHFVSRGYDTLTGIHWGLRQSVFHAQIKRSQVGKA